MSYTKIAAIVVGGVCGSVLTLLWFEGNGYYRIRNCAELAAAYMELGKREYGLSSLHEPAWQKAIEQNTLIQKVCQNQFPMNSSALP